MLFGQCQFDNRIATRSVGRVIVVLARFCQRHAVPCVTLPVTDLMDLPYRVRICYNQGQLHYRIAPRGLNRLCNNTRILVRVCLPVERETAAAAYSLRDIAPLRRQYIQV